MVPPDPFAQLAERTRSKLSVLALGSTAVLSVVLAVLNLPLQTPAAPRGIVAFELAGSMPVSQAILASWNAQARIYAGLVLGLDYAYMPSYSTALALVCAWASRRG